ncbi:hypothetical protein HF325_001105 [Metschnikowia pulcherrima]|uniref:Uncharacterized protein n=1 Tax=Metschnikowia pulcherrima TaxID=27326 RepID=A0A8H7LG44_9ASCO|nr:hypothetical protein HF325_001105 [Metschnikowia pulcherrima]
MRDVNTLKALDGLVGQTTKNIQKQKKKKDTTHGEGISLTKTPLNWQYCGGQSCPDHIQKLCLSLPLWRRSEASHGRMNGKTRAGKDKEYPRLTSVTLISTPPLIECLKKL